MRFIFLLVLLNISVSLSAFCDKPRPTLFQNINTTSLKIQWVYNDNANFEIAYNEINLGINNAFKISLPNIRETIIQDLIPGKQYHFWIRSICSSGVTSEWEGPYTVTTIIDNKSSCNLNILIDDNSCNQGKANSYAISVNEENSQLMSLESVSLIIDHTWIADLNISLVSPSGKEVVLSNGNGISGRKIGENNGKCDLPLIFNPSSCNDIRLANTGLIGEYKPEGSFADFQDMNPNGIWYLKICDQALNDAGILKYVRLDFNHRSCPVVEEFFASKVDDNSFVVNWTRPKNCVQLQVKFKEKNAQSFNQSEFLNCNVLSNTIKNLKPETEYEFFLISSCGINNESNPSCIKTIKTLCKPSSVIENFEDDIVSSPSCTARGNINGVFSNILNDDQDWLIAKNNTPTKFTGPMEGSGGGGHYAYIESNPSICGIGKKAVLESKCLRSTNKGSCDFSFDYHMWGKDIGTLKIEISIDNGTVWNSLFSKQGPQSEQWLSQQISNLVDSSLLYKLRIIGTLANGGEGDMALDNIRFTNAVITKENVFYKDNDNDGIGGLDSLISCSSSPPLGYVQIKGDCNDSNPLINPSLQEIACNSIDENCDGIIGLENTSNPVVITNIILTDASCTGKADGKIKILATGGKAPLQFDWGFLQTSSDSITNLKPGKYRCLIRDIDGCGILSPEIILNSISQFKVEVDNIKSNSCLGVADGEIKVKHNSNFPPQNYLWNTGSTESTLKMVRDGVYSVTITDNFGCTASLSNIRITPASKLNVVVAQLKNPFCFGDKTGIIEVNALSGLPPIKYQWQDGSIEKRRTNLPAGEYRVLVTDTRNCMNELDISIMQPDELKIQLENIEHINCHGGSDGSIMTSIKGGTKDYNYYWSDDGKATTPNREKLKAGIYNLSVSDAKGCTAVLNNIIVEQSPPLTYSLLNIKNPTCFGRRDGSISMATFGGVAPYFYSWKGSNSITSTADSIAQGDYIFTTIDSRNCKVSSDIISLKSVNQMFPIEVGEIFANKCPNGNSGIIQARIKGGRPPYDFNWSNGTKNIRNINTDTLNNLGSGIYRVTVSDGDACISVSESISIKEVEDFIPVISINDNICLGDKKGAIFLQLTGGTMPYKYSWSNGMKSKDISNLGNGKYRCTITDNNGCNFITNEISVSSLSNINVIKLIKNAEIGNSNGSANLIPNGGKGLYTIEWENELLKDFMVEGLKKGCYSFRIIDELLCEFRDSICIDEITSIREEFNKIVLFPNPTTMMVELRGVSIESITRMSILDINGKVYTIPIDSKINLEKFLPGQYFLFITSKEYKEPLLIPVIKL